MPGTVLGAGKKAVNKADKTPALVELTFQLQDTQYIKYIKQDMSGGKLYEGKESRLRRCRRMRRECH